MVSVIPGDVVRPMLEAGMGPREIANHLESEHGIIVKPHAISQWRARHTDVPAQWSTVQRLPWQIQPQHRSAGWRHIVLSYLRREAGLDLGPEQKARLDSAMGRLAAAGQVIDYDPVVGFQLVPRRPGGNPVFRDPALDTGELLRSAVSPR